MYRQQFFRIDKYYAINKKLKENYDNLTLEKKSCAIKSSQIVRSFRVITNLQSGDLYYPSHK